MRNNIILIGFMGAGKTSVGKHLADKIGYDFRDTDQMIEESQHQTIAHLFDSKGEKYFREMETEIMKELTNTLEGTVLSTGGGLPLKEINQTLLRQLGTVIYLSSTKETTLERVAKDGTRPILASDDIESRIEQLLKERVPIYKKAAHIVIETDDKSFEEVIQEIQKKYKEMVG